MDNQDYIVLKDLSSELVNGITNSCDTDVEMVDHAGMGHVAKIIVDSRYVPSVTINDMHADTADELLRPYGWELGTVGINPDGELAISVWERGDDD